MGLLCFLTSFSLLLVLCHQNANSIERDRRMIGGHAAVINDWNFAASLVFLQPLRRWQICTATVVHRLWLLTAAHCVDDITDRPEYLQAKIYSAKDTQRIYGVERIVVHPMHYIIKLFSTSHVYSWDFDIALVKLNESVPNYVIPAKIAEKNLALKKCRSAGWGSTEKLRNISDVKEKKYKISTSLQEIEVPLVPWEACFDFRNGNHESFAAINRHVLCGGAIDPNSSQQQRGCIGDSGSPLICSSNKGKVIYGVLLGGDPLCNQGSGYMIFAHVTKHREWIYGKTR